MIAGDLIGSYRVQKKLGEGGMGVVFLAYDTTLHRQVALKVVKDAADGDALRARLLREARNAAALNHPHICTVHEVRRDGDVTFIAMEYVEGRSLRDRIDEGGALPYSEALGFGAQAADALAYAHERGVVHRDLKAANAMVTSDGRLKLVDFGLARRADALIDGTTMATMTPAGSVAGTPYAMAPEQVRGEDADARTDVWALGVLLFEMLTGATPFQAPTLAGLFAAVLTQPPARWPRTVPVAVRAIVERCLEKEPARRYQSARELQAALDAVRAGAAPLWTAWRYRLGSRGRLAAAAATVIVVAALVGLTVAAIRDRFAPALARDPQIRLAVLPFENLTGDPDQAYFSDGLTEEMITQLGRLHPQRLSVIARASSTRYGDRRTPVEQMARELRVDYVLDGSARREGSRVRVSAALIDVRDGTQRWADSFERELSSILTLQSDIARGVSTSLALALLPEEQRRLADARPINPEAYEAYLRGLSFQANPSPSNLNTAERYFELAMERDPNYAAAYTGVAGVWFARLVTSLAPMSAVAARARPAIDRALALDGTLADAHVRLAQYESLINRDWDAADREYRRAIELNPNQSNTRSLYADYLAIVRRPDEALAQASRALELDPVSTQSQTFYARILMFTRRHDEAIARYRETLKNVPDQQVALANIRLVLHAAGRYEEAYAADRAWADANKTTGGPEIAAALARGYAAGGYRSAMRSAADAQAIRAATNVGLAFAAAQYYVRAGETILALDWLEKSFDSGEAAIPYLSCAPTWDDLRAEPRFQSLLRRMKLPA